MTKTHYAKGFKCVEEGCGEQVVAFWPIIDPDIQSWPYCGGCLEKRRNKVMRELFMRKQEAKQVKTARLSHTKKQRDLDISNFGSAVEHHKRWHAFDYPDKCDYEGCAVKFGKVFGNSVRLNYGEKFCRDHTYAISFKAVMDDEE